MNEEERIDEKGRADPNSNDIAYHKRTFESVGKITDILEPMTARDQIRVIRSLVVFFEVPVKDL